MFSFLVTELNVPFSQLAGKRPGARQPPQTPGLTVILQQPVAKLETPSKSRLAPPDFHLCEVRPRACVRALPVFDSPGPPVPASPPPGENPGVRASRAVAPFNTSTLTFCYSVFGIAEDRILSRRSASARMFDARHNGWLSASQERLSIRRGFSTPAKIIPMDNSVKGFDRRDPPSRGIAPSYGTARRTSEWNVMITQPLRAGPSPRAGY